MHPAGCPGIIGPMPRRRATAELLLHIVPLGEMSIDRKVLAPPQGLAVEMPVALIAQRGEAEGFYRRRVGDIHRLEVSGRWLVGWATLELSTRKMRRLAGRCRRGTAAPIGAEVKILDCKDDDQALLVTDWRLMSVVLYLDPEARSAFVAARAELARG